MYSPSWLDIKFLEQGGRKSTKGGQQGSDPNLFISLIWFLTLLLFDLWSHIRMMNRDIKKQHQDEGFAANSYPNFEKDNRKDTFCWTCQ